MRAFNYSDSYVAGKNVKNSVFFSKEKAIAWEFVNRHIVKIKPDTCSVCGCSDLSYLFQIWDVNYYICEKCGSVFTPVDCETMSRYLELGEMIELRKSNEYQNDATERRSDTWDDMLRWLVFRIFRYTGEKEGLSIIDFGDRYVGQVNILKESQLCGDFSLVNSILDGSISLEKAGKADVLLYLNQLQHEPSPRDALVSIGSLIKPRGLLVLSTRLGSGFDILTLKGGLDNIFPFEHIMLPSKNGLEILLENAGYELLEFLTPGALDVKYVLDNIERVENTNLFVKQLLSTDDGFVLLEFQRLLQKAGLSSFAQVVAMKK